MLITQKILKNVLKPANSRFLTKNDQIQITNFVNRNPRNLEKLRIAYKPVGYHLEQPGRSFWHKLDLSVTSRHIIASIKHFENGEVLTASTKEWAIQKQLYRYKDTAAYINIGRVLARRCLESGLMEVRCNIVPNRDDGKVALLLKALEDGGVKLSEPDQYKKPRDWDQHRPEKPWEITE